MHVPSDTFTDNRHKQYFPKNENVLSDGKQMHKHLKSY